MKHEFVEYIPEQLADNTLYISLRYATAVHLCCCGCGGEVVTPLARSGWTLKFDGTVSLAPSIGNWSFSCRSHYWITSDTVVWARRWSSQQIADHRATEQSIKARPNLASLPLTKRILQRIRGQLRRASVALKQTM